MRKLKEKPNRTYSSGSNIGKVKNNIFDRNCQICDMQRNKGTFFFSFSDFSLMHVKFSSKLLANEQRKLLATLLFY